MYLNVGFCVQLNDEGKVADCMTTKGVAYGTACSEQFKVSSHLAVCPSVCMFTFAIHISTNKCLYQWPWKFTYNEIKGSEICFGKNISGKCSRSFCNNLTIEGQEFVLLCI